MRQLMLTCPGERHRKERKIAGENDRKGLQVKELPSCGGYWFWAFYSEGRWPKLLTKLWDGTLWTSTMIRLELYGMKMSRNRGTTTPIWRILTWKSWYVVRKLYQTFCIEWNCEYIFFQGSLHTFRKIFEFFGIRWHKQQWNNVTSMHTFR